MLEEADLKNLHRVLSDLATIVHENCENKDWCHETFIYMKYFVLLQKCFEIHETTY